MEIVWTILQGYLVTTLLALAVDQVHRRSILRDLDTLGWEVDMPPMNYIDVKMLIPAYNVFVTILWIIRYDIRLELLVANLEAQGDEDDE